MTRQLVPGARASSAAIASTPTGPHENRPSVHVVTRRDDTGRRIDIQVDGEIDLASVDRLRRALAFATADGAREVVVDLGGVTFLGCAGLNCLAHYARLADGNGVGLYTIANRPACVRPIELAGLAAAVRLRAAP